jgi:hypothetical protein
VLWLNGLLPGKDGSAVPVAASSLAL